MRIFILAALLGLSSTDIAHGQTVPYDGRPTFSEREPLAYYLWREGNTWHLRWTSPRRARRFSGSVSAEGGQLISLKRIDSNEETLMLRPNRMLTVTVRPSTAGSALGSGSSAMALDETRVKMEGKERITFSARTNEAVDGFDFRASDVGALRFILQVDGKDMPSIVRIGRDNQTPSELPIVVTLP